MTAPFSPQAATLRWAWPRNCALTPRQTLLGLGCLCVPSLGVAATFWVLGYAWISLFTALELAAVAAALCSYARHACDRETLILRHGRLIVEQRDGGLLRRTEFDSAWVRVEAPASAGGLLVLSQRGRRLAVGRHLRPSLREGMARELRQALTSPPVPEPGAAAPSTLSMEALADA